jgi:RNA polymerase sigma-70 factor (ECF subfamily)
MSEPLPEQNLEQMETCWTVFHQAHAGSVERRAAARAWLVERYEPVVRRYLQGAVNRIPELRQQPDVVDDLVGEFAERLLTGRFQNADPSKGRFRHFLKASLSHMLRDRFRELHRHRKRVQPMEFDPECVHLPEGEEEQQIWCSHLIKLALERLRREGEKSSRKKFLFTVLDASMNRNELYSHELARELGPKVGKEVDGAWVRQCLVRARDRLAQHLVDLVAEMLPDPSPAEVEEELRDLGLYRFCWKILRPLRR